MHFMLSVSMLNAVMLSVVMLSVVVPVKVMPNEKTLAYYKLCQFTVNYESVMFYSKCPNAIMLYNFLGRKLHNGAKS
jgi:hypothetical protein